MGPWRERIYLAGGLAPRYIVGALPEGAQAHVGTADVDLIIGLALDDQTPETYRTLETNLKRSGSKQSGPSFRWRREVEGVSVIVEFLCETEEVEPGQIFRPRGEGTGSGLGAINVRGAHLVPDDFLEVELEGERLDRGGRSKVAVRVANLLPYIVLKAFAFQDRHENKDAYDLVFCILNFGAGPATAGKAAARSPVAGEPVVREALQLVAERFETTEHDGPVAYASFLALPGDAEQVARLRRDAVAEVREFLRSFRACNLQRLKKHVERPRDA